MHLGPARRSAGAGFGFDFVGADLKALQHALHLRVVAGHDQLVVLDRFWLKRRRAIK